MANTKIGFGKSTPFGNQLWTAITACRNARAAMQIVMQQANAVSSGGVSPQALEGSPEFGVAVGQGAAFYAALQSINAALFANASTWQVPQAFVDLDQG